MCSSYPRYPIRVFILVHFLVLALYSIGAYFTVALINSCTFTHIVLFSSLSANHMCQTVRDRWCRFVVAALIHVVIIINMIANIRIRSDECNLAHQLSTSRMSVALEYGISCIELNRQSAAPECDRTAVDFVRKLP